MEYDTQNDSDNTGARNMWSDVGAFTAQLHKHAHVRLRPAECAVILRELSGPEQSSTPAIFYKNGGQTALMAYTLTKKATESRAQFKGKSVLVALIKEIENTPPAYREALASAIAKNVTPEATAKVQESYRRMMSRSSNAVPREQGLQRRMTDGNDGPPSTPETTQRPTGPVNDDVLPPNLANTAKTIVIPDNEDPATTSTPEMKPIVISDSEDLPTTSANTMSPIVPSSRTATYNCGDQSAQVAHHDIESLAETEQILVNASLAETTKLYPPYLSSAVRRVRDPANPNEFVAAISMKFPNSQMNIKSDCEMALEIAANKVEHMAMELFSAHLETIEGLRYIYLPGGAKVWPNPNLTLQGCKREVVSSMFGSETANAIMVTHAYQMEVKQGLDRTDCISMEISQGADMAGLVFLRLGLGEGSLIAKRLNLR
ncbi:hypothetical protein PV04_05741 [Phialophora macrospora]|uniref:Uncharacterized protein n=1 Tax=Phialophora macrospora TaxID=1851006 RepID=A0A0D2FI24_9EURO|nr:hypothetical protein PV04_05741 [Phialophora macrospora]